MNQLMIIGNLTREPETRFIDTANGRKSVTNYTVAVNERRNGEDSAKFFRVTSWDKRAENDFKFLHKGSKVCVVGPVSASTYTANDGSTRVSLDVTAQSTEYLSSRGQDISQDVQTTAPAPAPVQTRMDQQSGMMQVNDEELPF